MDVLLPDPDADSDALNRLGSCPDPAGRYRAGLAWPNRAAPHTLEHGTLRSYDRRVP